MATAKKSPIHAKKQAAKATGPMKPIKEAFNRTTLIAHLAAESGA